MRRIRLNFMEEVQILMMKIWTSDGKKQKRERDRYGIDFIHRFSPSFILNVGVATEPGIKMTDYNGKVSKSDWFYYTGRIVYKF